jgi:spore maturation protein SpmB
MGKVITLTGLRGTGATSSEQSWENTSHQWELAAEQWKSTANTWQTLAVAVGAVGLVGTLYYWRKSRRCSR